ncbi:Mg transporter [Lactarius hengduanensis]|nr:Mg transporter [Lactarius hengduanensis]
MHSDMEMSHLEQPPDDDDDSDSDNDNDDEGARALLTTRGLDKEPATRAAATLWNQIGSIVLEALPTLLFTTMGLLFTGELFAKISHWNAMTSINELIAIVLAILNLKGNIEMNLSARLGTAANMGDLDVPSTRKALILGNLALIQVQAAVVSFVAACFPFLLSAIFPGLGEESQKSLPPDTRSLFHYSRTPGLDHSHRGPPTGASKSGFNEFMVVASTAMSSSCLSAILLGSFMSGLVVLCRKLGRDPDNIAPPIAACLGDLVTMSLLGAMSTVLTLGIATAAPYAVVAAVTLFAIMCASIVRQNEHVRPLLSAGWTPLLGAMVIASASGIVLDAFVSRYEGYAILGVAFGGIPGGAGSIFVSRLSTALHAAASVIAPLPNPGHSNHNEPSSRVVMLVLFLVSIPVGVAFFFILRVSSWLATPFLFTVLALFFLCTAIAISLVAGYALTNYLWSHKYDPDMYALPIHAALMDLVGQLLLVACFELASAIGLHVRSHSSEA